MKFEILDVDSSDDGKTAMVRIGQVGSTATLKMVTPFTKDDLIWHLIALDCVANSMRIPRNPRARGSFRFTK